MQREEIKLIAFDMEGVLAEEGSWKAIHTAMNTLGRAMRHEEKYMSGEITFEEWAEMDVSLWYGTDIDVIEGILNGIGLIEGVDETLSRLEKRYEMMIISGGLGHLAERIGRRWRFSRVITNDLIVKNNKVVGVDTRVSMDGKGRILKMVMREKNLEPENCAAVGDYINDIPMFREAGFSIAFDPKHALVEKNADVVVRKKDLRSILDFFV